METDREATESMCSHAIWCGHWFRVVDNTQRRKRVKMEGKKEFIVSHFDVNVDIRRRGGWQRKERGDAKKDCSLLSVAMWTRITQSELKTHMVQVLTFQNFLKLSFWTLFYDTFASLIPSLFRRNNAHRLSLLYNFSKCSVFRHHNSPDIGPWGRSHSSPGAYSIAGRIEPHREMEGKMCDDGQRQSTAVQCRHRLPSITESSLYNSVWSVCAERLTGERERDGGGHPSAQRGEGESVCVCVFVW